MGWFRRLFPARKPGNNYQELFAAAGALLSPHLDLNDRKQGVLSVATIADVETAVRYCERAVALEPRSWQAMWLTGKAKKFLGAQEEAKAALGNAWQMHKGNPELGRELSKVCMETGDFDRAVTVGQELVASHPRDEGLIVDLAVSLLMADRLEEAREQIDEAIAMSPSDPVMKVLQSRIRKLLSEKGM